MSKKGKKTLDWVVPYLSVGPKPRLQSISGDGHTWEELLANGITRIIDLTDSSVERRDAGTYRIDYRGVMVPDRPEPEELFKVFETVHEWIDEERKKDGRVYLHCLGGNGRSPTACMAHLMAIGKTKEEGEKIVTDAHGPTWQGEDTAKMKRALQLWGTHLRKQTMDPFLDHQSLGLKRFLEGGGRVVRDVTEITGDPDTSKSIDDDIIAEYLKSHPNLLLITKDTRLARMCEARNLSGQLMYIDETEAVAKEALRRLGIKLA